MLSGGVDSNALQRPKRFFGVGRMRLPDGSSRFVVDAQALVDLSARLGARWLAPLKTTNVEDQRCMRTCVLEKG